MYCIICGQPLNNNKITKWQNCGKESCRKEVHKLRVQSLNKKQRWYIDNPSPEKQKRIEKMRKDLHNQETFAIRIVTAKNNINLAKEYGIHQSEITKWRIELFGNLSPKQIHMMGKKLVKPEKEVILERKPILVQVYKIVDMTKFEQSGTGTYEGLKFDRIEYANEIALHTKSELLLEV